jgi:hypothetical protein
MTTLPTFFDMVYVNATETSGHGPFTLGTAVTGFQTAAAAGITNGTPVSYRATDGANWETAHGVIDVSGGTYTLTRGVDTIESSNSNSLVSFGSGVTVLICPLSQDLNTMLSVGAAQSFTLTQQQQGRTNLGAGAVTPGHNILIDGGFTINQRGYVSAASLAAGAYGHDRWKAGASGGGYSFTQLLSPTQITIAASNSLIQVVENVNVVGGSYVLSWTGTATARYAVNSNTPSGNFAVSPILITGQTAGTTMSVEFTGAGAVGTSSVATNTGTLSKAQLEIGAVATPFEWRQYSDELLLCQRYLPAWLGLGPVGFGLGYSTTAAQVLFAYPVSPCTTPSGIIISNAADFSVAARGNAPVACSGVTLSGLPRSFTHVVCNFTGSSGFALGEAIFGYINNAAGYILFSGCEL